MKVVRSVDDTVLFEKLKAGDSFYPVESGTDLYMVMTFGGKKSCQAVSVETGAVREFIDQDSVRPVKARVVIEEIGRVACGFNPR